MVLDTPSSIAGFPFMPVEFDKHAQFVDQSQVAEIDRRIAAVGATDALVLAHGWNNDTRQALRLYQGLLAAVARQDRGRLADRSLVVVGVFWPSKKFADPELIPGRLASVAGDLPESALCDDIDAHRPFFDAPDERRLLDELIELVPRLEDDRRALRRFGACVQELLGRAPHQDAEVDEEMPAGMLTMRGDELVEHLAYPRDEEMAGVATEEGGIATPVAGADELATEPDGGAAFLTSAVTGLRAGARNALNLCTYYRMKRRAGRVGSSGLRPMVAAIVGTTPGLRVHFAGHSFGGRLVTACVNGEGSGRPFPARSMTLLQAAFSHNAFAAAFRPGLDGWFRGVATPPGIPGPIIVTHTANDLANRWAYPMASRLARQNAAAFGGPDDEYGAMGSNGAQSTPEADDGTLLDTAATYAFVPGRIHNLRADAYISSHGDVVGAEVAHALVSAMT